MPGLYHILLSVIVAGVAMGGTYAYFSKERDTYKGEIAALAGKLESLEQTVGSLGEQASTTATELARRSQVVQKSQEDLLTAAVSKLVPSVVSIVVSKDVPKLEVVYENPFGDDPFFSDFNIRVPRYVQKGTQRQEVGAGSGFVISSNGYIATNRHVAEDVQAYYSVLLNDGTQKTAALVYRDTASDFAILKIDAVGLTPVAFGNSSTLKLGQSVFAIGNTLGEFGNSVSVGIISGLNRDIEAVGSSGPEKLTGVIQTDAAINPGNSGGPLVDLEGKVVGINVAKVQGGENVGFAIPANVIREIISSTL